MTRTFPATHEFTRPQNVAGLLFVVVVVFGSGILGPGPGFRDSAELGAAAQSLGVAHPTGFPWDMLILRVGGFLPIGSVAFRQNLVTLILSSAALCTLVGVIARLRDSADREAVADRNAVTDQNAVPGRGGDSAGSLAIVVGSVIGVATLFGWSTFRQSAFHVEVYAGALLLVGFGALESLRHQPRPGMLSLLFGLSLGAHVVARLALAPLLLCAMWPRRSVRMFAVCAAGTAVGALTLTYIPLASAADPPLDWGDPDSWGRFFDHVFASRIRAAYAGQMGQFNQDSASTMMMQLSELWLTVPLWLVSGAWLMTRAPRRMGMVAGLAAFDIAYALFINPMGVEDRQVGHLAGSALAVLAGLGGALCVDAVRAGATQSARVGGSVLAVVCAGAIAWEAGRQISRRESGDHSAAVELLGLGGPLVRMPARGVVVCRSDDVCAGALFARYGLGIRPDVDVVPVQHLWEPHVRRVLNPEVFEQHPAFRNASGKRPASGPERAALVADASRALVAYRERPVRWETDEGLSPDVGQLLGAALPAPFLAVDGLAGNVDGPAGNTEERNSRVRGLEPRDPMAELEMFAAASGVSGRCPGEGFGDCAAWSRAFGRVGRGHVLRSRRHATAKNIAAAQSAAYATRAFRAAVRTAPSRATAWSNLGAALASAGDLDGAVVASVEALARDDRRAIAWVNLVTYLRAAGRVDESKAAIEEARRVGLSESELKALRRPFPSFGNPQESGSWRVNPPPPETGPARAPELHRHPPR